MAAEISKVGQPDDVDYRELFEKHTAAVAEFLNELWAIMVDPLDEGTRTVAETMEGLKAAALEARQRDFDRLETHLFREDES